MFARGDLAIVAVSGGPDSICLLDVLAGLSGELGIRLHVAHLNHHMREQAESDARMVREMSAGYGVPCTIGHADVPEVARQQGTGLEEAGRIARYRLFRRVKEETGAARIALGHNLNDQAETVLMRLLRGSGTEGLAGIPAVKDDVVRPLIYVPRRLTEDYCREKNLPTILDVYNLDLNFTRNLVRLKALPLLADMFNPSLIDTLSKVAVALRWDADFLNGVGRDAFLGTSSREGRVTAADRKVLSEMPPAVSSRVLEECWRECAGTTASLGIERARDILEGSEKVISLPLGVTVQKDKDALRFYPAPPASVDLPVPAPGEMDVPELGISISTSIAENSRATLSAIGREKARAGGRLANGAFVERTARLDYNKLGEPLRLRVWRSGDRFTPLGMGGREQKLQDFFVSKRVSRFCRGFVPILVSGRDIVWVVGQRLSESCKVTPETRRVLLVEARPYLRPSRNYATIWRSCPTSGRAYS